MLAGLCITPLLLSAMPAHAADSTKEPNTIISVTVYGEDPCPQQQDGEIVVCARKPESERYRIPKKLREQALEHHEQAWGARVEAMDQIERRSLPGGCSPFGAWGQWGCTQQMISQWYRERKAQKDADSAIP